MVQKYRCATVLIVHGWESGNYEAEMKSDSHGTWVKLSTYRDETARLNAEILRLKRQVSKLQTDLLV